jgi:urease gamma subunit
MNINPSQQTIEAIRSRIIEGVRLKKLSNMELIRELMQDDITDDPRVAELMDRLMPNWLDEI